MQTHSCSYTWIHRHKHIYIYTHTHIHRHIYTHTYTHTHMHTSTHTCTHMHKHTTLIHMKLKFLLQEIVLPSSLQNVNQILDDCDITVFLFRTGFIIPELTLDTPLIYYAQSMDLGAFRGA